MLMGRPGLAHGGVNEQVEGHSTPPQRGPIVGFQARIVHEMSEIVMTSLEGLTTVSASIVVGPTNQEHQ